MVIGHEEIGLVTILHLGGNLPEVDSLPRLPAPADIGKTLFGALSRCGSECRLEVIEDFGRLASWDGPGLRILYSYGHAWTDHEGPRIPVIEDGKSKILRGRAFIASVFRCIDPGRTILIFDLCYAATLDPLVSSQPEHPRLCVFVSGENEKAMSLTIEKASRFSLTLAYFLEKSTGRIDLASTIDSVSKRILDDGILPGQTVTYRMHGRAVILRKDFRPGDPPEERTPSLIGKLLVAGGAASTLLVLAAIWYYFTHAMVVLDLGGLQEVAGDIRVVATEENPETNSSVSFLDRVVTAEQFRFLVPASNLVIKVMGDFEDGRERGINHHIVLSPGFGFKGKIFPIALPPVRSILARPGMAFVPSTPWFQGKDSEPTKSMNPFWIDIRPPTTEEYHRFASEMVSAGKLDVGESILLSLANMKSAEQTTGSKGLGNLASDLGDIFSVIETSAKTTVSGTGDLSPDLFELPCPTCPAPMSYSEAKLFCSEQGKRLPTNLEWELAARGVDGRIFPWGNRVDHLKANLVGLPDNTGPGTGLKPIHLYRGYPSPFGIIDAVGNAGDWVENATRAYERVHMGATYRFEPTDATTFRMLPVTDSDLLVREVTARCAADPGPTR